MSLSYASIFAGIGGFDLAFDRLGMTPTIQVENNPNCIKVLNRHWPNVPKGEDVRDVSGADLGRPDVVCGGFPCFAPGTLVTTVDGERPIEELTVGDLVLTHERRWRPIVQTMSRDDAPLWRVQIMGGAPLTTTAEHPFYVRPKGRVWDNAIRQYRRTFGEPQWVAAKDLTRSHFAAMPISPTQTGVSGIGDHIAYLIGRWLADGWVVNHKRRHRPNSRVWKAVICSAHGERSDELAGAIAMAGLHATKAPDRTVTKFHISSKSFVETISGFGRGAPNKRIAPWVHSLPAYERAALIAGWLDGDGSQNRNGVTATSVSPTLIQGMARLTRDLGYPVSIYRNSVAPTAIIEGRTVNQRTSYTYGLSTRHREAFVEDGYVWMPVRSAAPTGEHGRVHNIGVEEDESYVASGYAVHNCQDTSIAAPHRKGISGNRSGLFFEFTRLLEEHLRLVDATKPTWTIIENPEGLLKSNGGRDMAAVVGGLEDIGYGWAYRVVDGRHLGTTQRRRRVLVVGHLGGDPGPAWQVLGDPRTGEETDRTRPVSRPKAGPRPVPSPVGPTGAVIWRKSARPRAALSKGGYETWVADGDANTLTGFDGGGPLRQTHLIYQHGRVRTLSFTEWERLSGFPDDWSAAIPDSARFQALGNAMAVPMAAWLGRRLLAHTKG